MEFAPENILDIDSSFGVPIFESNSIETVFKFVQFWNIYDISFKFGAYIPSP